MTKDTHSLEPVVDRLIELVDASLNTLWGKPSQTEMPETQSEPMTSEEEQLSASLMRVNHTGEICAQALYEGQALVARDPEVREHLKRAAAEESAHLGWCKTRLDELNAQTSLLDPLFYAASAAIGVATGLMGDRVSLGFVEATEDQVQEHLDRHLKELPSSDARSRAILDDIRRDEVEHGESAMQRGGVPFPSGVRAFMTLASKVMTESTKRI